MNIHTCTHTYIHTLLNTHTSLDTWPSRQNKHSGYRSLRNRVEGRRSKQDEVVWMCLLLTLLRESSGKVPRGEMGTKMHPQLPRAVTHLENLAFFCSFRDRVSRSLGLPQILHANGSDLELIFDLLILSYVCECLSCLHSYMCATCMPGVHGGRRGQWVPWDWGHRWL